MIRIAIEEPRGFVHNHFKCGFLRGGKFPPVGRLPQGVFQRLFDIGNPGKSAVIGAIDGWLVGVGFSENSWVISHEKAPKKGRKKGPVKGRGRGFGGLERLAAFALAVGDFVVFPFGVEGEFFLDGAAEVEFHRACKVTNANDGICEFDFHHLSMG